MASLSTSSAGYYRIGVLKSIGFTPGQVVAAYTAQVGVPAVAGCLGGVALGNLLSAPLLHKTADVYNVGQLGVPLWVNLAVPLAMCVLVVVAAIVPALRGGRLSATEALRRVAPRAPGTGIWRTACWADWRCPGRSRSGWRHHSRGRPEWPQPSRRSCLG